MTQLQQGFATSEMGFNIDLRCKNPEPPMSALGQKQTLGCHLLMSALPPKADIEWHSPNVRFVPKADITLRDGFSSADGRMT
jgi:hypothetical protein